jgi:TonB family protein
MKQCSTCLDEFADKFSFCPVDGTPLKGAVVARVEPSTSGRLLFDAEETLASNQGTPQNFSMQASQGDHDNGWSDSSESFVPQAENEYHLTIMDDAGLVRRLTTELREVAHESQLTWPEFKRDPFGFTKRLITGYGRMAGGFFSRPNVAIALITSLLALTALAVSVAWVERSHSAGVSRFGVGLFAALALGLLVALFIGWFTRGRAASLRGQADGVGEYSTDTDMPTVVTAMVAALVFALFLAGAFIWLDHRQKQRQMIADKQREDLEYQGMVDIPDEQEKPDKGTAGTNKGKGGGSEKEMKKPGGGGGGGREDPRPASQGKLPQASLTIPQVRAPDPNPPPIKNPSLPVVASIDADPLLFPPDLRPVPYGDPKSKSTELSSGPGSGNGIGTGTGGGVGSGEGGGVGPGRGGNTGGGDRSPGGGGPGGGGGGDTDYNKTFKPNEVTQKARILAKPSPEYTEEARKNQVTGTVTLQMVFSSSGGVTNIRTISGLPYGLTEKAIAAARRIQFTPAMKDGRPVSQYIRVEYNFNIY